MKKAFFMMDFDRTVELYVENKVYKIETSDIYYPTLIDCIKRSNYKEILEQLQKI